MIVSCLICQTMCRATSDRTIFLHADGPCPVRVVNELGASSDGLYERVGDEVYLRVADPELLTGHQLYTPIELAVNDVFDRAGVPRLGGSSGTEGWSSISTYQRCPYAWARNHLPSFAPPVHAGVVAQEPFGRGSGTVLHTLLAIYYQRMITPKYALTPQQLYDGLKARSVDLEILCEGWRLFVAYTIYYRMDSLKPLWPERLFISPTSKRSCRVDLGVIETRDDLGHPAGLYLMDHKSAQRFDDTTLTGWHNDGGIIQQADIFQEVWERDPELQQHGPLQGVIVNLVGKQKDPGMYRAFVHPDHFQVHAHRREVPYWQAQRNLSLALGVFPRARNGCIGRFGKCDHWDHCLGAAE